MIRFSTWKQNWMSDNQHYRSINFQTADIHSIDRGIQGLGRMVSNTQLIQGVCFIAVALPLSSHLLLITGLFMLVLGHELYTISSRFRLHYVSSLHCFVHPECLKSSGEKQPVLQSTPRGGFVGEIQDLRDKMLHLILDTKIENVTAETMTAEMKELFQDTLVRPVWERIARLAIYLMTPAVTPEQPVIP